MEPKSYWSNHTGPVTRDDFNEYKAWAEGQISNANGLALESASTLWNQARELEKEKILRGEAERKIGAQPIGQPGAVDRWMSEDRGTVRKPRYTDADDTEERQAERGQFLYKNRSWRMKELRVTTLLLRAQVAVENDEAGKALECLYEAQNLAVRFQFPALEARCQFWRGRAEFSSGSYETALAAFQEAVPCEGVYREGLEVREWIRRAAAGTEDPPEEPVRTRAPRRRPRPDSFTGGAEHPPNFDLGGESDDEGYDRTGEHPPNFDLGDEFEDDEDDNTGDHRPNLDCGGEIDDDKETNTGEPRRRSSVDNKYDQTQKPSTSEARTRFPIDDEFDEDEQTRTREARTRLSRDEELNGGVQTRTRPAPSRIPLDDEFDEDEQITTREARTRVSLDDEFDEGVPTSTRPATSRFALDDEFDDGEQSRISEARSRSSTDEEIDEEFDEKLDEGLDGGEQTRTRPAPSRFPIDDEFDEGEEAVENYKPGSTADEDIFDQARRDLDFPSPGGRAGGGTLSAGRTGAVSKGKGRATEDDFLDDDEDE